MSPILNILKLKMLNALDVIIIQVNAIILTHMQSYVIQETAESERWVQVILCPQKFAGKQIQAINTRYLTGTWAGIAH